MAGNEFQIDAGQMVGEYRIERKIGEGAFGVVYAAIHPVIGKPAAVKVLRPALSANPEMVQRFADEARAVNQIRHRHIVDIFSLGTLPNGASYFVMELLTGTTLQSHLKKNGPLDPAFAAQVLWPVGRALMAAHKAGIAHRDLKPENVFLATDQDGEIFPKLMDFGIAKLMGEEEGVQRTKTGMVLGTPVYMSPEQCRATKVDHRADIYSFGIMVHEVLAGTRPFEADNVMDVMMKQISDPPPKLSDCKPGLPKALDAPILHMLEKMPAKRPQTMQAALDELGEALRACGIAAPPSSGQAPGPTSMPVQPAAAAQPAAAQPAPSAAGASPSHTAVPMSTGAFLASSAPGAASMAGPPSAAAPYSNPQAAPAHSYAGPMSGPGSQAAPAHSYAGSMAGPVSQGAPAHSYAGPMSGPVSQGAPAHSYAGPMSGPVSQGAPGYPQPPGGAAAATMLSAGVSPGMGGPSFPNGPPSMPGASMAGPVSASGALPAQAPSRMPLFLAAGTGAFVVLVLLLVAAFALGDDGSGSGSGSGAVAAGSGSAAATAVIIGGAPPRVGRTFQQESDATVQMTVTVKGATPMTTSHQSRVEYKATVLAVNEWHATRIEVQYGDHFEVDQEPGKKEKKVVSPIARRGFFVASQDKGASVGAMDGKEIDEDSKADVLASVSDLVAPRPDVFKRPLTVGDSLSPPASVAGHLLGLPADDPDDDMSMRPENTVLKLTAIDTAAQTATFDVKVTLVFEEKGKSKVTFSSPLQGTMTFDIPTGIPASGTLSGPLEGELKEQGITAKITGSMSLKVKGGTSG